MVEGLPANWADQSLNVAVLPWRSRCRWSISNSHRLETPLVGRAVRAGAIADQVSRRLIPTKCFSDLTSDPLSGEPRRGVCGDDQSPIEPDDDQRK